MLDEVDLVDVTARDRSAHLLDGLPILVRAPVSRPGADARTLAVVRLPAWSRSARMAQAASGRLGHGSGGGGWRVRRIDCESP